MRKPIPQRLMTILILGACIFANLLVRPISFRLDLSNGQAYSISQSSKKIISSLPKQVTITFFSSKKIPSTLTSVRQEIDDFLSEYSSQTGGKKITYLLKDPDNDTKAQQDMQNYSIPRLQFSQQDQDQFAMQNAYFGIGISYDGKHASLPQVTDVRDLEYNLTSVLYKLSTPVLPIVGVIGAPEGLSQLQSLATVSQSQFGIEETSTPSAQFRSLIVFGSDVKQYTQDETSQLKEYLQNGGSILFFVDGVTVNDTLLAQDATHDLFALLKSLGITLAKDLVRSKAAELVSFGQSQSSLPMVLPYSYWIKTNELAKESLLSNVKVLVFPWASSVSTSQKITTLVRSEPQSWHEIKSFNLSPQNTAPLGKVKEESFPLIVSGNYGKGRFIVIPSSRFVLDGFLSRTNDNMELVMNALSEYASGGALSGIRSRAVEYYPLPTFSEPVKNTIKYLQIFLGPTIFAVFGLVILIKRSRQK